MQGFNRYDLDSSSEIEDGVIYACTRPGITQRHIRRKLRHNSLDSRRRSSIDRIMMELDEFKIEIQKRFKRSKFNNTFKFPRKSDRKLETVKVYEEKLKLHYKSKSSLAQSNRGNVEKLYDEELMTLDMTVNKKLINEKAYTEKAYKIASRFNTGDNFKNAYDRENEEINEDRGKVKSARNLNKISFGKPPNQQVQVKTKKLQLSEKNKHVQHKMVKSGSRNKFNFNQKSDVPNKESTILADSILKSTLDCGYELSANNTLNEINQEKSAMKMLKGQAFNSQSSLFNNIGTLNQMMLGRFKDYILIENNTNTLKTLNSAREYDRYSQSHYALHEPHPTYQPLTRREPALKREMNEFLSNYSNKSHHIKKDSMKKSGSWVKLGDSIYCTTQDNHSRKSSKNSKFKKLPKSKNQSSTGSDKKLKIVNKSTKFVSKNQVSMKKLKTKKDSSFGVKSSSKKYISGKQNMTSYKNGGKLQSSSCINLMIPEERFKPSHSGRATFDVTSLKKHAKNYSPSRITEFYEPKNEFVGLVPYSEMKFQNTVDLRNTHRLMHLNQTNDSYLNFQVSCTVLKQ
jgi:hypothetical protein